eukprot:7690452-Pyramimonas_sp.AAC.1
MRTKAVSADARLAATPTRRCSSGRCCCRLLLVLVEELRGSDDGPRLALPLHLAYTRGAEEAFQLFLAIPQGIGFRGAAAADGAGHDRAGTSSANLLGLQTAVFGHGGARRQQGIARVAVTLVA